MSLNKLISRENQNYAKGFILGAKSGAMTGIAAGADVFGLVNLGGASLAITSISAWWYTTTDFDDAQSMGFLLTRALGFTALHTGGTPVVCQAHPKGPSSEGGSLTALSALQITAAISGTAAITAATYTAVDADEPMFPIIAPADTSPVWTDVWVPVDGMPLILPTNTGIVGKNLIAMGASGVGSLIIRVEGFTER